MLIALVAGLSQIPGPAGATPVVPRQPNIVLILTDDEDVAIHAFMPKTKALIEEQGTTFDELLRQLSVVLPVARLDPARPVRAQHQHRRQRAALGRLREVPPARARGVDDRHLAAGAPAIAPR